MDYVEVVVATIILTLGIEHIGLPVLLDLFDLLENEIRRLRGLAPG
jgi:hypothetical protein